MKKRNRFGKSSTRSRTVKARPCELCRVHVPESEPLWTNPDTKEQMLLCRAHKHGVNEEFKGEAVAKAYRERMAGYRAAAGAAHAAD